MMEMSRLITPPAHTQRTGPYSEDAGGDGLRINAFNHEDGDVAFDPLSTNWRFPGTDNLAVLGTQIFRGHTRESINVMIPDCLRHPSGSTPPSHPFPGTGDGQE